MKFCGIKNWYRTLAGKHPSQNHKLIAMKPNKLIIISWLLMMSIVISNCKKEKRSQYGTDGSAPDAVINPKVTYIAGAALITYTLPDNENMLYVKAVYDLKG